LDTALARIFHHPHGGSFFASHTHCRCSAFTSGCLRFLAAVDKRNKSRYDYFVLIQFDPAKDAINRAKHGVSLGEAGSMDWDSAVIWRDDRMDYGEVRMCGLGYLGMRLYFVVFVDRGDTRRIISLRKANPREYRKYASS